MTEDRVELIADDFESSALTEDEKAVIRYTDVLLAGGHGVADALGELRRMLEPGQVVELTAGVALFMGFSKIAITLGQAPADMPTMDVPTPDWAD